ncbi:AlwI family type II restriction endonuclease [Trueperella sp. LYQ143]|uniref:AlwI family type II restriction endonuclease n=1 Tax=unclassified Trueperella TaxID=2630174 RepID=UPI00398390A6
MIYENIPYRSFCWVLGTTSFRTAQLNLKTEQQLRLLRDFTNAQLACGRQWMWNRETQSAFYDFMKDQNFLSGEAPNKDKDARQKTSGLTVLGLVTHDRELTAAGIDLLDIFDRGDFSSDNILAIPKDSFFYLRQLLKTTVQVDGIEVRPFLALAYLLNRFEFLTWDEFAYLLPLVSSPQSLQLVEDGIAAMRRGESVDTDEVIFRTLMAKSNYQEAWNLLQDEEISEELITTIGMNRKSRTYDKPYYQLFTSLEQVFLSEHTPEAEVARLLTAAKRITGNAGTMWRKLLFRKGLSERSVKSQGLTAIKDTCPFLQVNTRDDLKRYFFKYLHLFKAKATLEDYFDLNRRYIKLSDTVIFDDRMVTFDTIPAAYFALAGEALHDDIFAAHSRLHENTSLSDISPRFAFTDSQILDHLSQKLGRTLSCLSDVHAVMKDEKNTRLHELLCTRFTDEILCELLDCFERRDDSRIAELVTDEATISTIFEYVLALVWFRLSGNKGDVLSFMKLQLEADLLPRSHAIGGDADIIYDYEESPSYPAHCLVIEATLADSTNQRRMEMEPVSRHLGNQIAKSGNATDYCIFIAPYLDLNTVNDFRSRKNNVYFAPNNILVENMKIIPISTAQVKHLLHCGRRYEQLYAKFDAAFHSEIMRADLWLQEISQQLQQV